MYAHQLHTIIRDLDAHQPCGWIVDLSDNQGGNMWPMLAGIGPILGTGIAGYFQDTEGVLTAFSYDVGQSFQGATPMTQVAKPYTLRDSDAPVAILTSKKTASSGEAIVVAFRERPNTRSFGQPTAGLSTGNNTYTLSDGATLVLTEVVFVDRTRTLYGQSIEPDEQPTWFGASVRDRATAWLHTQPSCQ
ncbi:MAG: S41 family peptidase [Chloroflexota bacterium]